MTAFLIINLILASINFAFMGYRLGQGRFSSAAFSGFAGLCGIVAVIILAKTP